MRYKYTETKTHGSEIRHPAKHLLSMEKTPMKHGGFQLVIHGDPWRETLRNEASRSGKVFVFGFAVSSLKRLDEAILKG